MTEDFEELDDADPDDPGFLGGGGPPSTLGDDDPMVDEHGDRLAGDLEQFDDDEV
jgi:hypothetical protein